MRNLIWYAAGLHFECIGCGNCCSGPEEGYIWTCDKEAAMIADELKMSEPDFRKRYTKKEYGDTTLIENEKTKDCIFLQGKRCQIYSVRPNQCRTWPFWDINLESPDDWGWASTRCPGINRGRRYSCEEIEMLRMSRKWWND